MSQEEFTSSRAQWPAFRVLSGLRRLLVATGVDATDQTPLLAELSWMALLQEETSLSPLHRQISLAPAPGRHRPRSLTSRYLKQLALASLKYTLAS